MKNVLVAAVFAAASLTAGEMVLIPGGSFIMGGDGKDAPKHQVTVSPFMMDKCEVTQKEFRELTAGNPSRFKGDDLPVECIRWHDAARFCNARSAKEGLKPCYNEETWECDFTADGYRLPTEAEWEYACRAGSTGEMFFKGGKRKLAEYAWFRGNSQEKTHPVGSRKPNAFGLYDMYGNVAEWCNDCYDPDYYANSPATDPRGPGHGTKRVLRGGSWQDRDRKIGSSIRVGDDPATADICQGYDTYGFRCVRKVSGNK